MRLYFVPLLVFAALASNARADDEKIFSGPQLGEKLKPFKVVGVYGDLEGKEMDFVEKADGKPVILIFVHELQRPTHALVRAVTHYAKSRQGDGLHTYIVWLHRDRTDAVNYLKRAAGSLNYVVPVGVSVDGAEGPGAYGLNRKVGLTVLVAKDNKVTANFALIQPGLNDAPAIAEAIVKQVGGKAPTLEELEKLATGGRPVKKDRDPQLERLLRMVINKDAQPEGIAKAAEDIEKLVGEKKELQKQLGEIAAICVKQKYGTDPAQKYLQTWAEKYGPKQ